MFCQLLLQDLSWKDPKIALKASFLPSRSRLLFALLKTPITFWALTPLSRLWSGSLVPICRSQLWLLLGLPPVHASLWRQHSEVRTCELQCQMNEWLAWILVWPLPASGIVPQPCWAAVFLTAEYGTSLLSWDCCEIKWDVYEITCQRGHPWECA